MSRIFLPRFVTQTFIAGTSLLLWAIMSVFMRFLLVYHWLYTVNCKVVAILDCHLPWHDCHLGLQWNTSAAWATIHFGFPVTPNQWKPERLKQWKMPRTPWYSSCRTREMCHTNRDQRCWAALRLYFNSSGYLSKPFLLSYVFVHVDVWYFKQRRCFRLVIWEWLRFNRNILLMHVRICTDIG